MPCPQAGFAPVLPPRPCSTGLGSRAPLFQGPQEVPLAPGTVLVWGWGDRAGVQGRKFLTRRAKDRVVPYPRSHPCAHSPCPLGWPAAFLSLPALLQAAWYPPPTPILGQPGRNMNGKSPTNTKKTVEAPSTSLATPVPVGQATCHVHVECQHLPCFGPIPPPPPPPPWPVSEIAH